MNSFEFPPKKSLGNKSERFVEDRRRCLQAYHRSIVNYLVSTSVGLSGQFRDKETLLTFLLTQVVTLVTSQLELFGVLSSPSPRWS